MPVNENIQLLLKESSTKDASSPEFNVWCNGVLADFPVKAYGVLRGFEIERFHPDEGQHRDFRLRSDRWMAPEVMSLVSHAWYSVGGHLEPTLGLCYAALASIENVRAQLCNLLWIGSRLDVYRTYRPEAAQGFVDSVLTVDWHDAEAVLKANFQAFSFLGVPESSADNLYDWIMNTDRPSACSKDLKPHFSYECRKTPEPCQLMSGAALIALDAALDSNELHQSFGLMAFAANAMWQAGWQAGWDGREDLWRQDAKHAGKKGGTQRHQASRELKRWALTEAISLRGSDIEIARKLVSLIPARLQNASADPERLIYDALRSDRRGERQGG